MAWFGSFFFWKFGENVVEDRNVDMFDQGAHVSLEIWQTAPQSPFEASQAIHRGTACLLQAGQGIQGRLAFGPRRFGDLPDP